MHRRLRTAIPAGALLIAAIAVAQLGGVSAEAPTQDAAPADAQAATVGGFAPAQVASPGIPFTLEAAAGAQAAGTPSGLSCAAQGTAGVALCPLVTDNYKDCFNAADSVRENRTYALAHQLQVAGGTYILANGQTSGPAVTFTRTGGSTSAPATIKVTVKSTSTALYAAGWRVGSTTTFGPLIGLKDPATFTGAKVDLVAKRTDGTTLATSSMNYKHDQAIYDSPKGTPEYNGPGGRWYVSGQSTPVNGTYGTWPAECTTAPPPAGNQAPKLVSVTVPSLVHTRSVTVKVNATDDRAVTEMRLTDENGVWDESSWKPFAATTTVTSTAGYGYKGVYVQVRDASKVTSPSVYTQYDYEP